MSSKRRDAGFTGSQETLLGLGSTLGIVLQFLILLPYLRAAGFRFRPRFDFRHTGLGRTLGLGTWTVAFVIVNQVAFAVIVNLSGDGSSQDSGFTLYTTAFLVATVPHSVIAVSLATAALPALSDRANRADLDGLRQLLVGTLRNALAVLAPLCALLPLLASYVAAVMLFGAAGGRDQAHLFSSALALFAPGVLLTSVHYLLLRGLYAVERNKSAFFNQFWVALVNIVAAFVLVGAVPKRQTALALIGAYDLSYVVGVVLSVLTLTRMLRGLEGGRTRRYLVRLALATAGSAAVAWLATRGLAQLVATPAWPTALAFAVLVTGVAGAVFLVLARLMHLREVTQVLRTLTRGRAG
jgi:putative peptidoglycan lipid II flippase